jgi:hypothetical protein
MSGAIEATLRDVVMYWAPGTPDSTGQFVYLDPETVKKVRVDSTVAKEIRDLLQNKVVSGTVWSLHPFEVGGWICRQNAFDASGPSNAQYPQLIAGAKQIIHVGDESSRDRSRVFWRAVI